MSTSDITPPEIDPRDYYHVCNILSPNQGYACLEGIALEKFLLDDANWERQDAFVTGYYEPLLEGSLKPSTLYSTPLYKLPKDNDKKHSRHEIASGALDGKGLEICWVKSAIDAFFLEIQGSGRILLEDGKHLCLGYAGQNGHPYVALGKHLVTQGHLTIAEATLQGIKALLTSRSDFQSLLNTNPSYVYFKEILNNGPIGTQGAPLTPMRSLAVDPTYIPLGSLLWVDIEHPAGGRIQRFMIAQDTGGAIKGAGRADFFWGYGKKAEENAGKMRSRGTIYILKNSLV